MAPIHLDTFLHSSLTVHNTHVILSISIRNGLIIHIQAAATTGANSNTPNNVSEEDAVPHTPMDEVRRRGLAKL